MHQALSADKSLREAIVRVNADRIAAGTKPASLNTSSYSDARKDLPTALLSELTPALANQLEQIGAKAFGAQGSFKGRPVKLADGSTILLPDTTENQMEFPQMASQEEGSGFPIARIVVVFSLFTGATLDLAIGPYKGKETGEHALLRQLLHCFEKGDILLGDAYYASYFLMALLVSMGVDFVFQSHGSRKSDFRKGERLGSRDHIIELKKPKKPEWMDDETYAQIPDHLKIREVNVTIDRKGFRSKKISLTTSMLDPKKSSKDEIGCLYACRWAAELNLRDLKTTMTMDMLRSKTPDMVRKEIWAHLLAYNAIRKIMLEAAIRRGVLPWQISFKATVQTINHYSTLWRNADLDRSEIYVHLLAAIGSQIVGKRPGRSEPRMRKRRAKSFPLLHGKRRSHRMKTESARQQLCKYQGDIIETIVAQAIQA